MSQGPKLFRCPTCRHSYLGQGPLPDCPRCGYDYRETAGFRWDVVVYILAILGLMSFLLVASQYRTGLGIGSRNVEEAPMPQDHALGAKPGTGGSRGVAGSSFAS